MPPSEDSTLRPEPPRRSRVDAWEAVVRQELLKARRHRATRLLAKGGLDRVIPALRENRSGNPPREPT